MPFQPADTLRSRTYIGLIAAQFLAAFNDQAIHASAMFYAIHRHTLSEAKAISLMPILFYAPWAVFCTLAGYLADRHSKRSTLVFWKIAEIGITFTALIGFCLGGDWGPITVLFTVFLMGMHSAFFVPAKYGCLPEILHPTLLSKGNGILESTSFLAVILGTVSGGMLSSVFRGREYYIGILLLILAIIGAAASFLIERMPAANPTRPFPRNLFKPLLDNLRTMLQSRPLALAVLGIAFFTFMVAYMRATMYMHGESRIPSWNEFKTSLVVATVALGVGLGSPLAGFLSGGKVELGLVPLGALGMILACLVAAFTLNTLPWLIVALILIGFFSGFYIVPLYTLLQHRAPKASKGDLVATSNFINVTGAIAASILFFTLGIAAHLTGLAPEVPRKDVPSLSGKLVQDVHYNRHGRPEYALLETEEGKQIRIPPSPEAANDDEEEFTFGVEDDADLFEVIGGGLQAGEEVITSTYTLPPTRTRPHAVTYWEIRRAGRPLATAYDNEQVPQYLFMGAGLMTLAILILLYRQLPDLFVRSVLWMRSLGRSPLRIVGAHNLPGKGPAVLVTNCAGTEQCMQVLAATDRYTRFILFENSENCHVPPVLGYLTRWTSVAVLRSHAMTPQEFESTLDRALRVLAQDGMVGLPAVNHGSALPVNQFLQELQARMTTTILPVYYGDLSSRPETTINGANQSTIQVVIGSPLPAHIHTETIQREIDRLRIWIDEAQSDDLDSSTTVRIPEAEASSRPETVTAPPNHP